MPFPFLHQQFQFHQPDGEIISVQGSGNQYHAVFETNEGFTVIQNSANGIWEYARHSADDKELVPSGIRVGSIDPASVGITKHLRAKEDVTKAIVKQNKMVQQTEWMKRLKARKRTMKIQGVLAPPSAVTKGTVVGLCLLIDFPDVPHIISRDEVDNYCNQNGYTGYSNNGSVRDYFYYNSQQNLTYKIVVTDWYTSRHSRSYYTNESIPQGQRAQELIKEALTALKNKGFDFTQLTRDAKGNVKALNTFYAGEIVNNWGKGLWPHSWSMVIPFKPQSGIVFKDYQITNMGSALTLATFCHENAHMVCDFPDLYDYGYESNGIGVFCLMCNSNATPSNPQSVCAYLRYKAGWVNAQPLSTGTFQIRPQEAYIWKNPQRKTEYFILELRINKGRDAALPGTGLTVWHVDELGDQNYEQATATKHYECSLMQADGKYDLEKGLNEGQAVDLFQEGQVFTSTSKPRSFWWNGTPSGLEIIHIKKIDDSSLEIQVQ